MMDHKLFSTREYGRSMPFTLVLQQSHHLAMIDHRKNMGVVFEKLETQTLCARIANQTRDAILEGSLKPGEKVVERKLAAQFGASLTAVREALVLLESEGFIKKRPNSATYVTKLTLAEAEQIQALRRVLEGYAVEEAARLATPEQVGELERLYLEMMEAARKNDSKLFVHKDLLWHERVWQISDNEFLRTTLRRLMLPFLAFSAIRLVSERSMDLMDDAYSHLPILKAIKSGDPKLARGALETALEQWISELRQYVFGGEAEDASRPAGAAE